MPTLELSETGQTGTPPAGCRGSRQFVVVGDMKFGNRTTFRIGMDGNPPSVGMLQEKVPECDGLSTKLTPYDCADESRVDNKVEFVSVNRDRSSGDLNTCRY